MPLLTFALNFCGQLSKVKLCKVNLYFVSHQVVPLSKPLEWVGATLALISRLEFDFDALTWGRSSACVHTMTKARSQRGANSAPIATKLGPTLSTGCI